MENQKKPFHITITNNETGEVLHNDDTALIIGAWDSEDNTTSSCILGKGPNRLMVCTVAGCIAALKKIKCSHPIEYHLAQIIYEERAKDAEAQKDSTEE